MCFGRGGGGALDPYAAGDRSPEAATTTTPFCSPAAAAKVLHQDQGGPISTPEPAAICNRFGSLSLTSHGVTANHITDSKFRQASAPQRSIAGSISQPAASVSIVSSGFSSPESETASTCYCLTSTTCPPAYLPARCPLLLSAVFWFCLLLPACQPNCLPVLVRCLTWPAAPKLLLQGCAAS